MTNHQTQQGWERDFDEEFIGDVIDPAIRPEIKSFIENLLQLERERVAAAIEELSKNLVVDNWEDGKGRICNPRCHDSGKEQALTDLKRSLGL